MANTPSSSKLLVIGNGWPVPARSRRSSNAAAASVFEITMFGDEPYGNYNRIMLSHVLSGETTVDDEDLILNPMGWYTDNGVNLHAGDRAVASTGSRRPCVRERHASVDYDVLDHRHGSNTFSRTWTGARTRRRDWHAGVRLPDHRRHQRHAADGRGPRRRVRRGHRRRPARTGSRVRAANPGPRRQRGPLPRAPDEPAARRARRRVLRDEIEKLGVGVHTSKRTTAVLRDEAAVTGVGFVDGHPAVRHGRRHRRNPAQHRIRTGRRAGGRTRNRGGRPDAVRGRGLYAVGECVQHRGEVYGLVAPVWEQAVVLAEVLTGANPERRTMVRGPPTKLKVAGVEVASMGITGRSARRRVRPVLRAAQRQRTRASSSATTSWSAPPCWATSARPAS